MSDEREHEHSDEADEKEEDLELQDETADQVQGGIFWKAPDSHQK
jgi:hypothetical protein